VNSSPAAEYHAVEVQQEEEQMTVVTSQPLAPERQDELRRLCGHHVVFLTGDPKQVGAAKSPAVRYGIPRWKMVFPLTLAVFVVIALYNLPGSLTHVLSHALEIDKHPYRSVIQSLVIVLCTVPVVVMVTKPLFDLLLHRFLFGPLPASFGTTKWKRFLHWWLIN